MSKNDIDMFDESGGSTLYRRAMKNPYLIVGVTGFILTAGIGAYKFKSRPKGMSPGLFLVQLRVAAQSAVIGCLTIGLAVGMFKEHILKIKPEK